MVPTTARSSRDRPGLAPRPLDYRIVRIAGPAALVAAALLSVFVALQFGGGAAPPALRDPGAIVRYGVPIAKLFVNLGAAGTVGALALACFAFDRKKPEFSAALDIAAASAAVWTIASGFTALFSLQSIASTPLLDEAFGDVLATFLTSVDLGRAWLATTLIAAAITVLCFALRNQTSLVFVTAFAVIGLIPMALQGHAGGTASHDAATTAIFLHVAFAGAWLGGLLTIALLRNQLAGRLVPVIARYSTIALICFIVVAVSGYVSAQIRVETLPNLLTPYGLLVLAKVAALGAIGLFGFAQRRLLIRRMTETGNERRYLWWVVVCELAFMGVASGVAAALARTATPAPEIPATDLPESTPAEILTGSPLPPELTPDKYFTLWNFDVLWMLVCGFGIFFYVAGVVRLRRRGDTWPWYRTASWIAGLLLLFSITNGGVNVYESYLFSAHMLAHMALGMMVPVLLVPGAPVTLALRAIHKRADGSRGIREWILLAVHSKPFAVFARPVVAGLLFAGSLWVFYYSPLFRWATIDHVGHEWMIVHFLLTGYLFVQSLIGIDPVPARPPYPIRLVILLATMAFHAFFGLALMTGTGLLLADWYGAMGRDWGASAIVDQQTGGGIAWSVGEIPTVILAIAVAILWAKSDERESTRFDRKADRDGDAELAEYNAMLAKRGRAR